LSRTKPSIVILGTGNVAYALGIALFKNGYPIKQVYSRSHEKALQLARKLKASFTDDLRAIEIDASVYLLAISDDALPEFCKALPRLGGIVMHTSGSIPLSVLKKQNHTAVIYPLQTLQKDHQPEWQKTSFLVEANDEVGLKMVKSIARTLTKKVIQCTSEERKQVHLAAVIASNFSNHLFALSQDILQSNKLPTDLLAPLIEETIKKSLKGDAKTKQTGPARRGDQTILRKHLNMLNNDPLTKSIYKQISASIQKMYSKKSKK